MKKDIIKDEYKEHKEDIINKFQRRENTSKITFGMIEATLTRHKPSKDYVCYLCDKKIEGFYYSRKFSGYKNNKKICSQCVPKIIEFLEIDLDKWERIIRKRLRRIVDIEEYLKNHEI